MSVVATVWREGDRIRQTNSVGYSDFVTDEQIEGHISTHQDDPVFIAFARAVLAIRAFERVFEEEGSK